MNSCSKPSAVSSQWSPSDRNQEVTIAIQGFGNVGYWFAHHADLEGYRIVAVSDSKGGVYVPEGLNPELTLRCKEQAGQVAGCYCVGSVCDIFPPNPSNPSDPSIPSSSRGKPITNDQLLALPVDILVPAALENAIISDSEVPGTSNLEVPGTSIDASKIRAKIVLELANGPTTPEADTILNKKGILVVPDVLANSGGVTTSYLEWIQNRMGYYWTREEVLEKLEQKMIEAFEGVWGEWEKLTTVKMAKRLNGSNHSTISRKAGSPEGGQPFNHFPSLRSAAYVLALRRIITAMQLRGL